MTQEQKDIILNVVKKGKSVTIVDLIFELGNEVIEINEWPEAIILIFAIDRLVTQDTEFMVEEINWKIDPKIIDGILLMSRFMRFLKPQE